MKLGIKVGPQKQSFKDLDHTRAPFAEVWFNIRQKDSYDELFTYMKKAGMDIGLHFWGHTDNQIWANIAYPDSQILKQSMTMMRETIDIAAKHACVYVNIHPSNFALVHIDFPTQSFKLVSKPAEPAICEQLFFENAHILDTYAKQKGIVLTLETIPSRDTNGWSGNESRLQPLELYAPDNLLLVKAATQGFTIANDFGHTACTTRSQNRSDVLETVFSLTKILAEKTRLLHIGYIIPPYNGTDFHHHLDDLLFASEQAVPNKFEMKDLLQLFTNRNDVYALAEPDGRHTENYEYIKKTFDI